MASFEPQKKGPVAQRRNNDASGAGLDRTPGSASLPPPASSTSLTTWGRQHEPRCMRRCRCVFPVVSLSRAPPPASLVGRRRPGADRRPCRASKVNLRARRARTSAVRRRHRGRAVPSAVATKPGQAANKAPCRPRHEVDETTSPWCSRASLGASLCPACRAPRHCQHQAIRRVTSTCTRGHGGRGTARKGARVAQVVTVAAPMR